MTAFVGVFMRGRSRLQQLPAQSVSLPGEGAAFAVPSAKKQTIGSAL